MNKDLLPSMDWGHFVDRLFWAILTSVALYAATSLREMSRSIEQLNQKMASIVEKISDAERREDGLDRRVDRLEDRSLKVRGWVK